MKAFDYDIIVIGGGGGGLTSAKLARGLGKKVALVEKDKLGGECTWTGCVPSKAIIKSAAVAYTANHLSKFGLTPRETVAFDTTQVMDHVRGVVEKVYRTHTPDTLTKLGIDVLFGEPVFIDNHHIGLEKRTISAHKFVLATGSVPFVPPIEGLDTVDYLTNQNLFALDQLPKSMIILGGGPIGAEMASALNRLGVSITVMEMQERILPREDEELVEILTKKFKAEGISLLTNMRASSVTKTDRGVQVTGVRSDGSEHAVEAERLLVALGRRPNVTGLHLENVGVNVGKKSVEVNEYLQTTVPNIYACGDVVGPYLFSHMAFYQATIAVRNAFVPFFKKKMDYRNVSWVTFTDPELATAGLTELAAREQYGDNISIYRYRYDQLDRAYTDCQTEGFGKFICDKRGRLIGAHILGARAGELICEVQVAKTYNLDFADLYSVIHPYPTYSELIWHSAKQRYIDKLRNNLGVKIVQWLRKLGKK